MKLIQVNKSNITKADIQDTSNNILQRLENGEIEALRALAWMKSIEKTLAQIKKTVTNLALDEYEEYGEKNLQKYGFEFLQKESGVRYDFTGTPAWNRIKEKENEIIAERKKLEQVLKGITKITSVIDDETGEVLEYYPPIKTSTTIIQTTLKG